MPAMRPVDVTLSAILLPAEMVAEADALSQVVAVPLIVQVIVVSAALLRSVTVTEFPPPGATLLATARSFAVMLAFGERVWRSVSGAVVVVTLRGAAYIVPPL